MEDKVVTVFRGQPVDADIIKHILEDNGIIAGLKNHLMGTIAPWQVAGGGFEPVEVEVLEQDKEKALEFIEEFKKMK